ncbi:MAG: Ig-like domain-containing protein, partial [Candidatus Falkowbacteria bacterium]|nr:Ig-like domain-containing protein [Candidatus Falkowbacteria bacterium]
NTVATSNTFVIDNIAPVAPTITSPLIATIINAANYSINGTAEADSLVKIYNTSSAVIGTQQLTGGATSFGISVSLAQNVANNFTVKATDVAGNEGVAGTVPTITADSIAPSVSISSLKTSPTNSSPFMITVSFSEAVTGFLIGDLAVSNGAASNLATADNITYTADITPTSDGPVTVNVNAAAAKDLANNDNLAATQFSINYDATPPTAIITASVASPTKITPFTTTITFSEPVSGFLIGGITVGNGTASNFIAASSTAYTASITPTADGAVTINVAGAKAQDLAGNNNTAATQVSIVFDGTPPSASQVLAVTNPTNDATPDITVNVEAGATFQILNGATVLGSTIGTGASQIITLTTLTEGVYNLTLVASDAVQNITTINLTQFAVDTTNPTMTITSTATSPTKLSPFMATFTFSEPVTGFAVGDIDVSNGAASNFVVASSTVYTAQITPTVDGVVAINVASAKAQDLAGNDNAVATQLSITSDRTPPTVLEVTPVTALANDITPDVVVNVEAGISFQIKNGATLVTSSTGIVASQTITLPTLANGIYNLTLTATDLAQNTTTINLTQFVVDSINPAVVVSDDQVDGTVRDADTVLITATFADASGIDEATVPKISIGSLVTNANMTKSSNLIWTYSWDVPTGNNGAQAVVITASDNANNPNSIATGVTTYAIDNTAPNISLSYSPNRNVADADTLVVTATFDETLSSAPLIAIDTTGTDLSSTAMTGGGSIWTYNYNVPAVSDGVATVSLSATDVAGNANNAPTNQTFAIDNLAPVITIATGTDPGPIQQDTINLTVADANTIATTTYGFSADAVCDQSDLYGNTFVSGTDFVIAGTHSDYLCAEAEDVAGNISYQLVGQLATDNAAPTLTYANISSNNAFTNLAKPTDTITLTIISDKNIANPTVMIAGSAADTVTQNGDAKHWLATSVMDSNDTEGSISFSVNFLDLAGNAGAQVVVATDASSVTFDKTAPNVTLSGTPQDPTSERDINILVGGANVTGYKYKLENGGYSAEISVATRLIRAELETVSHTLSVIGRDQAGNWQAAPTIYSWTISSGGGPMYFPPTPRATKYQVYSPATGKFIEVDIVYKDMPIVNTEPVSEKTQTHKMSADGTETFINRINTVVMGEIKSVEGSAKINIVDTPAMPQIIKFDAPTKSSVAGVSVELSKGVLFGLVNNYSADKDIKVDFAYDKAQPSQLNVGALGKGNSIVGNSVCSINMYSDTARISSFSNPLEIVFKTNNIVDKTGLTIASYN